MKFKTVAHIIASEVDIDNELETLIEYSLTNKTKIYPTSELSLKHLEYQGILAINGDNYAIADYYFVAYKLLLRFTDEESITLSNNFEESATALLELRSHLLEQSYADLYYDIEAYLWSTIILRHFELYIEDFNTFLSVINTDDTNNFLYPFVEGLLEADKFMQFDPSVFYSVFTKLLNMIGNEAAMSMDKVNIIKLIEGNVESNRSFAHGVFEVATNDESTQIDFLMPVITGLYNSDPDYLENKIKVLVSNEEQSISLTCGLSNAKDIGLKDALFFIKVYKQLNITSEHLLVNKPRLIYSVLKANALNKESAEYRYCKAELFSLATHNNEWVLAYILKDINQLEDLDLASELTLHCAQQPHFNPKIHMQRLTFGLLHINRLDLIYSTYLLLVKSNDIKAIADQSRLMVSRLRSLHKGDFDIILIKLLTNDNGLNRFMGYLLLKGLLSNSFQFEYDILKLNPLTQYKLWVSCLTKYGEPTTALPCLLPILHSQSPYVRRLFIHKLEEYSENYGSLVAETLENYTPKTSPPISKDVIERVKAYQKNFYLTQIQPKEDIKELDPFNNEFRLYEKFNQLSKRKMSNTIKEGLQRPDSFLSQVKHVTLLKGGGWKLGDRKDISKLSENVSSFHLPRLLLTEPQVFDLFVSSDFSTNWDEHQTFNEAEKIINDEQ